jgi:anti-sigma regulatory factor (Ser/Thr protein kinase)
MFDRRMIGVRSTHGLASQLADGPLERAHVVRVPGAYAAVGRVPMKLVRASDRDERSFPAVAESARAARVFVTEILVREGASSDVVDDFQLVVSELVSNVIEHGDGTNLVVYVDGSDPDFWEVEVVGGLVAANSRVLDPPAWTIAAADEPSGRGLAIVRHLMDHVTAEVSDGYVSIRCGHHRI